MRRWTPLVLCAPLALAACGSSSSGTAVQSPVVGASVLVNHDRAVTRQMEVPSLFTDTKNPDTIYLSGVELLNGECRLYISNDRGYSWTQSTAPSLAPFNNCASESGRSVNFRTTFAEGSDGTLFLAYAAYDQSGKGSRSALLGRSTDKGHTWQTVAVDASPPTQANGVREIDFEPHVAVDPANPKNVTVIWRRSIPTLPGITVPPTPRPYIATSTDGGATFSAPAMLFDRTMGFDPPYPVIRNGTLNVSWHETFPKPATGSTPPDKIWFSTSTDGGKTFTDNQVATGTSVDTPVLLYDSGRGKWNMFWDANNSSGDLDVFYASSTDGKSWSSAVRVNDDNSGRDQELPVVSLTPNGRIDVVFYDYRNDPFPKPKPGDLGARQDVYLTSSFDGGNSWGKNVQVNDLQIDRTEGVWNNQYFVQVPMAMTSGDTWALAAWSDTRFGDANTSTQDLFVAPMAFDTSVIPAGRPGAVSSSGYSTSDLVVVGLVAGAAALFAGAGLALLVVMLSTRRRRPTG